MYMSVLVLVFSVQRSCIVYCLYDLYVVYPYNLVYMHIERSGAESVYGYYMEQMMGGGGVGGKYVGQDSGLTNSLLKSG